MPSSGVCTGVPVYISTEEFYIDLLMLPLHDYELVLGCHWLKTLGPILWDLERRYMVFWRHDHHVQWTGADASCGTTFVP